VGRKRKRSPRACARVVPAHLAPSRHLHRALYRRPRQAVGLSMMARPPAGAQWRAASCSPVGARDLGGNDNRIPVVLHLLLPQPNPNDRQGNTSTRWGATNAIRFVRDGTSPGGTVGSRRRGRAPPGRIDRRRGDLN
jgi:hypothetical protein